MTSLLLITMPRAKGTQRLVGGGPILFPLQWEVREAWGLVLSCLRPGSAAGSVLWAPYPAGEGKDAQILSGLVRVGLFLRLPGFVSLGSAQHLFWSYYVTERRSSLSLGIQGHGRILLILAPCMRDY